MSTFVVIHCDRCGAKVGDGESIATARFNAWTFGARLSEESDLCQGCAQEEL